MRFSNASGMALWMAILVCPSLWSRPYSSTAGWIVMKFCTKNIHCHQMMYRNDFAYFPLAPLAGGRL